MFFKEDPRQVREAALVGAHIATLPFSVIQDMPMHHKTCEGMVLRRTLCRSMKK